ncbi:hypothetical protein OP10G_2866 [Fimbriimonas ginsengisoli Gsoil 348]|uniref:ABC transporter permease n=1 Tax=Fimbriimonas ginsengisoli Gsoil 348 TaxID=661478 RepID=A0A068NX80_FIMGI|nr:hypothetical protein OP10G_2866 [Fimbriimonas ginsengisoli Gsoil 348]
MIVAVALGVALFVSSFTSISGIRASIVRNAKEAAGNAQWRVSRGGGRGVPEDLLGRIRSTPNVVAAPFLNSSVTLLRPRAGKLVVVGVDMGSDSMLRLYGSKRALDPAALARMVLTPGSILITRQFADRYRLKARDKVRVGAPEGASELSIAGFFDDPGAASAVEGQIAFMELHQAQAMVKATGLLDYIDVAGVSQSELKKAAPGFVVEPVTALSPAAQDALAQMESLYGLSLVAMLIGCFVIFGSVQVTVLERIKEIATFRAIGASRGQVVGALLVEWLLVGLIGSGLGIFTGAWLATSMLRIAMSTVNAMVPVVKGATAEMTPSAAAGGFVVGVVTVLFAAMLPAISSVRESPLLSLKPHMYRLKNRQALGFWLGVPLLAAGLGLCALVGVSLVTSLAGIVLAFLGLAFAMPFAVTFAAGRLKRVAGARLGFPGFLATDNVHKAPQRTGLNVIALGGALGIMVATSSLVQGLGTSTRRWIHNTLPFDLAVTASDLGTSVYSSETIPDSLVPRIRNLNGVTHVYRVRKSFARHDTGDVMVIGIETRQYLEAHRRKGTSDWARPIAENQEALLDGSGAFASENFLALNHLRIGESFKLTTPSGERSFRILGSVEDYSWPRGTIVTDLETVRRLWKDPNLSYIDVQVDRPERMAEVRANIGELTRDQYALFIFDRNQIVKVADDVLQQTTAVANVQVWLAALIGFLGIGNSLAMSVLQRKREIGLLRAVGMSRRQLQQTVIAEALLVSIASGVMGMAGGLVGGWIPLRYFTFSVTGYLFPLVIPWAHMGIVFACAIVIGLIASILPMRQASAIPVLSAIAYE